MRVGSLLKCKMNRPLLLINERKSKIFLLNPLLVQIIILHLQRQTNKDNKKR